MASVQPGSGTAFSLLPAQNATGNFVKIVQRVPVKVIIDNPPSDVALGPGITLSAPLTKAHPLGSTVNGPTTGMISDSPQGQIVMVLISVRAISGDEQKIIAVEATLRPLQENDDRDAGARV